MMKHILFFFLLVNLSSILSAQKSDGKDYVIAGNQNYSQQDYAKAEVQYKRALGENANSIKANYNLGNALYHQKKYDESRAHYDKVIQNSQASKSDKHKAFHNIGRSYLDEKNPKKAVENLKEALKLNPNDEETRYNYALARKMLEEKKEEEEKNQDKSDQEQKDQNEEQQDQNDQDQQDQENGKEDQEKKGQNPKENDGQQQGGKDGNKQEEGKSPENNTISKGSDGKGNASPNASNVEYHESLLDALRQQEQETLKRIISQKAEKVRVNTEKDW